MASELMNFLATDARIDTEKLLPLRHPEFISGSLAMGSRYLNIGKNAYWIDTETSSG
ncbi:hypothetical protein [Pedobacter miscanthi]|nr:hypothetical protein [Pedobacter miscanthi]